MAGGTLLGLVESRNRTAQRKSRTAGERAVVVQQDLRQVRVHEWAERGATPCASGGERATTRTAAAKASLDLPLSARSKCNRGRG